MTTRSSVADRLSEYLQPTGQESALAIDFPDTSPRFHVSPRVALFATGAVAVLVGGIIAWSLFGAGERLSTPPTPPGAGAPGAPGAPGTAGVAGSAGAAGEVGIAVGEAETQIVVSVVGAVDTPGLVTLAPGARVADAITASGGLVPDAEPESLNQAQLLVDGQQLVVPTAGGSAAGAADSGTAGTGGAAGAAGAAGAGMVSLNSADAAQLVTLDGVGEATAAAIIEHRHQIGGFTAIEQLLDVSGIGPAKYAVLKDVVTL